MSYNLDMTEELAMQEHALHEFPINSLGEEEEVIIDSSSSPIRKKQKTKKDTRSRTWMFTLNNYTDQDIETVDAVCKKATKWIYGKEVGEQGTPHLQGYLRFKNQMLFSTLRMQLPGANILMATKGDGHNYTYCSKDGDFNTNMTAPKVKLTRAVMFEEVLQTYNNVHWKEWQQDVLDIIKTETKTTNTRSIHWIWENTGNVGKSFLAKYIMVKNTGVIICGGKSTDIYQQVNVMIEGGVKPAIVIYDVPRTMDDMKYVSYTALEKVKDASLYASKYEGGGCVWTPAPIVICFANQPPHREKMSADRWFVYQVKGEQLYKNM